MLAQNFHCYPIDSTYTPDNILLTQHLKFTINQHTVIQGNSGAGKSSLLRTVAGLWENFDGTIGKPFQIGSGGLFFLPQKSYMPLGTLRDAVIYPHKVSEKSDQEILACMRYAAIDFVLERYSLDSVEIWDKVLSFGEVQRLAFARLFYHKPKYAILDESTSALDVENEQKVMESCVHQGILLVSVAHRESVERFHQYRLLLDGKSGWKIQESVLRL